jgi:hypothetical protein
MRGTLKKNQNGWVIEPIRTIAIKGQPGVQFPLHPSQVEAFAYNVDWYEEVVDFEIKSEYVEPPEHIHSNRGGEVNYAFINNEKECICEVGRPYNNLACPVHGSAMFIAEDLDKKPSNISLNKVINTKEQANEFMNQINGIQFKGKYCVRTPEGKFISIKEYMQTKDFADEFHNKK